MATERPADDAPPTCTEPGCENDADFFLYDAGDDRWRAICDPHARRVHPSLEVHAWLESGYLKPGELGKPDGPPSTPRDGRGAAFRELVDEAMGFDGDDPP